MSWGCRSRNTAAGIPAYRWQINMIDSIPRLKPSDWSTLKLKWCSSIWQRQRPGETSISVSCRFTEMRPEFIPITGSVPADFCRGSLAIQPSHQNPCPTLDSEHSGRDCDKASGPTLEPFPEPVYALLAPQIPRSLFWHQRILLPRAELISARPISTVCALSSNEPRSGLTSTMSSEPRLPDSDAASST